MGTHTIIPRSLKPKLKYLLMHDSVKYENGEISVYFFFIIQTNYYQFVRYLAGFKFYAYFKYNATMERTD
ncbi:hypothetical protein SAMN04488134_101667 [Amphibacillus marinus]|uniref:Uncharacterized protein n=1 Tax=Amphibacillus marinus TaxID=872970 RepID=A0A1H8ING8_9BACI|nr:hypothetical protein SAMN04488134_101667 [Amphibacillus marinus]